jgi:hypothetical protein
VLCCGDLIAVVAADIVIRSEVTSVLRAGEAMPDPVTARVWVRVGYIEGSSLLIEDRGCLDQLDPASNV